MSTSTVPVPTTTAVQNPLNLMLTIKQGENADILGYLHQNANTINEALNRVGTVHFARFLMIPNTQLFFVITEYDGDFNAYIQAFTKLLGPVFDKLFSYMDPAPPLPVEKNVAAFEAFVKQYNLPSNLYAAYPHCTVQQIWGKGCAKAGS